jgi:UDP-N-acetylglucosamine 2-epimerase (non-hydrolysing)
MVIFGTRPEAIKLAPVINKLKSDPDSFDTRILLTAQHRQMVDTLLDFFGIQPDYDLNIMIENQSPSNVSSRVLQKIEPIFEKERPDCVVVQGDTISAMMAALSAFFLKIPVAHVEAGLRTSNRYSPFPEEMNRRLISQLSNIHFAANKQNKENLIRENYPSDSIFVTGNPVIDTLKEIISRSDFNPDSLPSDFPKKIDSNKRIILLTTHRRENFGIPQRNIMEAVYQIVKTHPDVEIIFPVHPNPSVVKTVKTCLPKHSKIHIAKPFDYISFVRLMHLSYFVMTDSGGIQEEAPALGKPVLVLRESTEREEILDTGNAILVGTSKEKIINYVNRLLTNPDLYKGMSKKSYPFGKGGAALKIMKILKENKNIKVLNLK